MSNQGAIATVAVMVGLVIIIAMLVGWGLIEGRWAQQDFRYAIEAGYEQNVEIYTTEEKKSSRTTWEAPSP